jgi:hypothetical protein
MKKSLLILSFLTLLSACADPLPQLRTDIPQGPKINLDVQTVTLADRSPMQPANSPYTTNNFQPTIAEAIRQWAANRFQAVGSGGEAVVIIKDASLSLQTIPHSNDWFKREQTTKYTAHAEVDIEIKGTGTRYALASAQASRFETLPENPSETERQNAYTTVLNGVMRDLNQAVENSIHEHMQDFVITAPLNNGGMNGSMNNGMQPAPQIYAH